MAINLLGAFAAGIVAGMTGPDTALRIIGLGFLGGFTTFSTWAVESLTIGRERGVRGTAVAMSIMLIGGVLVCAAGLGLAA